MLHQSSTVIIRAGSCWLFLLLGWAVAVNITTLPAKAQGTYLQICSRTAQQQDVSTAKERGVGPYPSAG
jgi:hypothetical protein